MKKSKNIIMCVIIIVILAMSVGYASIVTKHTINGISKIVGEWDVRITSVYAAYISENCDAGKPEFTNTSITLNAKLVKPGDYITYMIIIENIGTFDAILNNITFNDDGEAGSSAIIYKVRDPIELLKAGDQTIMLLQVMYDENTVESPVIKTKNITGIIEYIQE